MRLRLAVLFLVAAAAAGGGLYRISYATQALERELKQLNRALVATEEARHILAAEWSHLNAPARLDGLARRHLGFAPLGSDRIVAIESLTVARPAETSLVAELRVPRPKPSARQPAAPQLAALATRTARPFAELAASLSLAEPSLSGSPR